MDASILNPDSVFVLDEKERDKKKNKKKNITPRRLSLCSSTGTSIQGQGITLNVIYH
jgi:hypothetical protein